MTNLQVKRAIETKRIHLSVGDGFTHYGAVLVMILIPLVFLGVTIFDYLKGEPFLISQWQGWIISIFLALAFLLFLHQKRQLRFKTVETSLSVKQLISILNKIAKENKWVFISAANNVVIIKTFPTFLSWGEQITIIFDRKRVLINSICDPSLQSSIVGRNKHNVKILTHAIQKAGKKD